MEKEKEKDAYICAYVHAKLIQHIGQIFSDRGPFLALSAAGHAGGPACTPRRKCGSRPGSVMRALGVQSRAIWQVIAGSLSAELEPIRRIETPKI